MKVNSLLMRLARERRRQAHCGHPIVEFVTMGLGDKYRCSYCGKGFQTIPRDMSPHSQGLNYARLAGQIL